MGVCKGGPQVLTFDQVLPKGIRHLFGRIDLKGPGVFRIIRITCEPHDVKSKLDPKRNYLWNGGAERGLYGILQMVRNLRSPTELRPDGNLES